MKLAHLLFPIIEIRLFHTKDDEINCSKPTETLRLSGQGPPFASETTQNIGSGYSASKTYDHNLKNIFSKALCVS